MEIKLDKSGTEVSREEITGEAILVKHPFVMDLASWVSGARIGSKFSMISIGYAYEKLEV
jgi:hypothetical protein